MHGNTFRELPPRNNILANCGDLRFLLEQWHSKRPHLFQEVSSWYKQIAQVQELFLGRICIRLILNYYIKGNFTGLKVQGLIGLS